MAEHWRWSSTGGVGRLLALIGLGSVTAACVYDGDHRCDAGEVLDDRTCVCAPGIGRAADGTCVPCGENEETVSDVCVCAAGFDRDLSTGTCVARVSPGLGDACTDSSQCTHAENPFCKTGSPAGGYCTTQGCTGDTDCLGGYACEMSVSPAYCRRPPVGVGATCHSDPECAGTDATWCDAYQTQTCVVQGCQLSPNDCFKGFVCCDFSVYAAFGVPATMCTPGQCSGL